MADEGLPGWTDRGWDEPPTPEESPRIGVCCSGGGVRSAAFSLGALQVLRDEGKLQEAEYLAAVSGGAYMAAAWTVASDEVGGDGDPRAFAPGSPEERWLRNNSSYLAPDIRTGLEGVARLLAGIVVNLVVIWLLLFFTGHIVGWVVGSVHPELRAREPLIGVSEDPEVEVAGVEALGDGRFLVGVDVDEPAKIEDLDGGEDDVVVAVTPVRPAVVGVDENGATIVRQPVLDLAIPEEIEAETANADADVATLVVSRQPTLRLDGDVVATTPEAVMAELTDAIAVDQQPRIQARTGLLGRPDVTFGSGVFVPGVGALLVGLGWWFVVMAKGPVDDRRRRPSWPLTLTASGMLWLGVFVALPWAVQEVPDFLVRLTDSIPSIEENPTTGGSGLPGYLLPGGGFLALAVTAIRRYMQAGRVATEERGRTPLWRKAWRRLTGVSDTLAWYALSPLKIAVAVLAALSAIVLFIGQVRFGAANGWTGELLGLAVITDDRVPWIHQPDWVRVAGVGALLVALYFVDAHSWSLFPYYKRRLSGAYFPKRSTDDERPGATERSYEEPLRFERDRSQPTLIVCCAVNLSKAGAVPPGRRAASFTFSATEVGSPHPEVGYVHPERLWRFVGPNGPEQPAQATQRRKDLTIPAAMAISGAAFSPAMGKFNLGPVGSLLALANARLGVWLPRPDFVTKHSKTEDARLSRWTRPGWPHFLLEVINRYRTRGAFVYVSDGGHWENLGLVELLRRGCTEIYCVNAGGDGLRSFSTIAEAVALAREELGVEIEIDPRPLRPPVELPTEQVLHLRRREADEPEPLAAASFVTGTVTYPASDGAEPVTGTIHLIEPALTEDIPFDVHGHAEAEAMFPDDSTADQLFDHRQFESFRRLGRHQMDCVFAADG